MIFRACRPASRVVVKEFILLDDVSRLGLAIERDDAEFWRPALKLTNPVRDRRVRDDYQRWEALEGCRKIPNEGHDLNGLALKCET